MLTTIDGFLRLDLALQEAKTSAARKAARASLQEALNIFVRNTEQTAYTVLHGDRTPLQKEVFFAYTVPWAFSLRDAVFCSLKGSHKMARQQLDKLSVEVRFAE